MIIHIEVREVEVKDILITRYAVNKAILTVDKIMITVPRYVSHGNMRRRSGMSYTQYYSS